ncbi:MAG: hypothetical protein EXS18_05890 [Verrucomicrobiae bacterium]|nr:hypothetical protein [Verrucomicrobiae bacterium]
MNANQEQAINRLLEQPDGLGELAPHFEGSAAIKAELDSLKLGSGDWAACVRAGLYLRFNFLDESHTISQGIHTVEGSYWHAIMHRREPDYSNSKYWFRKVGSHPVLKVLPNADPLAFVDLCEEAAGDPALYKQAVELQRAEWLALFDHCVASFDR